MSALSERQDWPDGDSPAADWEAQATKRVLDELFCFAEHYRTTKSYKTLLKFVKGFRSYSPYNAMLVRIQMKGARFVLPAHRWINDYGRTIKPTARPLVILQPMGPVMIVFDVSDTEPGPYAAPLPPEIDRPFEVRRGRVGGQLERTIENAVRDGIRSQANKEGSQSGGSICPVDGRKVALLTFRAGRNEDRTPKFIGVPHRYDLLVNDSLSKEAKYATVVHELAHLYCGHLGIPDVKWKYWPDRARPETPCTGVRGGVHCLSGRARLDVEIPSGEYLADYFAMNPEVPDISVDLVVKVAGLIENMGRERMKPRE